MTTPPHAPHPPATAPPAQPSHRTSLHDEHRALGASFTDFGGWDMPLKYTSDLAEHHAVRKAAGLFDLSHMGEVRVTGPQAGEALDYALVGHLSAMPWGKAKYTLMCAPDGGIIDDLIVYRLGPDEFLVVPNAGNAGTVATALRERASAFDAAVVDESDATALVAVQGPNAAAILERAFSTQVSARISAMRYYTGISESWRGIPALVARTGYTGEDGFEIFLPSEHAPSLWACLLSEGADLGLLPAGLASRDSLRLEAGMPLYGHELTRNTNPFAAGLGDVVALGSKGDFVGRRSLEAAHERHEEATTTDRVLVGLVGTTKRAARQHQDVLGHDNVVGTVTSGAPSPTLGYAIAMAYVDRWYAGPGTNLEVDVRGTTESFTVSPLPFYRRRLNRPTPTPSSPQGLSS